MKKKYKVLLSILGAEWIILALLNEAGVKILSWGEKVIGIVIFLLPVQILLFLLGHDESISKKKRMFSMIAFWFLIICFISGMVETFGYSP